MPKDDDESLLDDVDILAQDFNDGGGILDTGGIDNLEPMQFELKNADPNHSLAIADAIKQVSSKDKDDAWHHHGQKEA